MERRARETNTLDGARRQELRDHLLANLAASRAYGAEVGLDAYDMVQIEPEIRARLCEAPCRVHPKDICIPVIEWKARIRRIERGRALFDERIDEWNSVPRLGEEIHGAARTLLWERVRARLSSDDLTVPVEEAVQGALAIPMNAAWERWDAKVIERAMRQRVREKLPDSRSPEQEQPETQSLDESTDRDITPAD